MMAKRPNPKKDKKARRKRPYEVMADGRLHRVRGGTHYRHPEGGHPAARKVNKYSPGYTERSPCAGHGGNGNEHS